MCGNFWHITPFKSDRQSTPYLFYLFLFRQSQGPSALPFAQIPAFLGIIVKPLENLAIAYNILNARW
jgi:hypothetical protein